MAIVKNSITFIKRVKYTPLFDTMNQVGEGTYGKVYKARNSITNEFVALKRLRLEIEREGFPITAVREIKLLQEFDHPNVVSLLEMMVEGDSVYMVFNYMNHDLTGLLSLPNVILSPANCKFLFKQILEGMEYLHMKRVIHRDIKGSNILLDNKGNIQIADFGLARKMKYVKPNENADYTNRVITLWYRPPELLLGTTDYGPEVDIWGIGCLLIELFNKTAIFQGKDEIHQLVTIYDILGTPSPTEWPGVDQLPWFELLRPKFQKPSRFQETFEHILPTKSCFELAENLLSLNPKTRMSAYEALQQDYFKEDPQPEELSCLNETEEWHEFDAKQKRRKERREKKKEQAKEAKEAKVKAELEKNKDKELSSDIKTDLKADVEMIDDKVTKTEI
ncbi:cyclin-dependent serine/threonine protein kinase CTK1 [Ascoidea rubescens DSM 1968]|uniref:Pkinase-domain-containing protein n=1 Tax=Ascoidea rubescens DSM 1968 TaxID=1344418 RepID=A0A1D2VRB5_9ASCO|nr:Pkinase-domain-containing protein [Ascoidea rubescens DSM 1968]ODV64107.1 Pkinase-domain-containing protein [Ascoidea rubescens DSM 1968]